MADPLLRAIIGKLPKPGSAWSKQQREDWLKLMSMAFDVVYPERAGDAGPLFQKPEKPMMPAPAANDAEEKYIITQDGRAVGPNGKPVKATEIPATEVLWDHRPENDREIDTIKFADGSWPAEALPPLNLAAA